MNLFFLAQNPQDAARLQADVHIVKMILESYQMLCTALRFALNPVVWPFTLCKITHKNHPTTKWIRFSAENYSWTLQHGLALCKEYTRRYEKIHALESKLLLLYSLPLLHFEMHQVSDIFDTKKIAYHDIPNGLSFIPLAISDDVFHDNAEYDGNHVLGISTYKNYYISKRYTMKRKMLWDRKDEVPNEFQKKARKAIPAQSF